MITIFYPLYNYVEVKLDKNNKYIVIGKELNHLKGIVIKKNKYNSINNLIEYENEEYVILLPLDENEDSEEVVILKVEDTDSDEEESYVSVDDEGVLNTVFEIFKEKFKDEFNFIDEEV